MAKTTAPEAPVADRMMRAVVELYAAAPGEFVEQRTELVRQARADKDREAAKEIGALRKPSTSAWAVNQVVRQDREVVEELRSLGARLRHAQATLDGAALAGLRGERDAALRRLASAAATAAEHHGQTLSEAVQAEIRDTAVAALADADAEEVAWSGSLTRALQYSGFGEVDVSDAVARTSTGVLLARIEGGGGREEEDHELEEEDELEEADAVEEEDEPEEGDEEFEEEDESEPAVEPRTDVDAGELEEARLTLEIAEHELSARAAQLRLVTTRASSTGRRRAQVETEVAELEQEVAELTARLEEVRQRLDQRSSDLERCRAEDEQAAAKVTSLEEAVAAATTARDEARHRVAELGGSEG